MIDRLQAIEERYEEIKNYLENHRDIINNKDYSITLFKSVVKRFKESFISWPNNRCVDFWNRMWGKYFY